MLIDFWSMRASFLLIVFLAIARPAPIFGQQGKSEWKEYKSVADAFTLSVPTLPTPHNSPVLPGATEYLIPLRNVDSGLVLRVKKEEPDCSSTISRLKDRISSKKNSAGGPSSVREVSTDGHSGIEYRVKRNSYITILERWYCVNDRLYIFSVTWPGAQSFPTEASIILDSFRVLPD